MRLTGSLHARLLLGAAAWGLLALAVTGVLLFYLFREHLEAQVRARLEDDLTQLLAQTEADGDGQPAQRQALSDPLYQRVLSGHYWQIVRDGAVLARSRSLWDQSLPFSAAPDGEDAYYRHVVGPRDRPLLVLTQRVTLPRVDGALRVQVATDLVAVESALRRFAVVLAVGLGVLALGLVLAAVLQVRLGLRPLRRMRGELAAIRTGDSDRLNGDYPREVTPLVEDLNAVLADNAALIERARGRAGNLAHALKTPLSILDNDADSLHRRGDVELADRLLQQTGAMQRQIDWHLAHARIAASQRPGTRTPLQPAVARLTRTLTRLFPQRRIEQQVPESLAFRGEAQDLEQMVGNLLENACKWARQRIRVSAEPLDRNLVLRIEDDGPGLPVEARQQVLERGRRLDESTPGDGLGLAIVREIAEIHGGHLELAEAELGGLAAILTLPATPEPRRAI